jgi:hypothetical protein
MGNRAPAAFFVVVGSVARGVPLTDEQQAMLEAAYAETGRFDLAATAAGCSTATARRYLKDAPKPERPVATVATLKTTDALSAEIMKLIGPIFEHMQRPEVIKQASLKEASTAAAIMIDKFLLLTGQATSRTDSTSKVSVEIQEAAKRVADELGISVEDVLAEAEQIVRGDPR